MNATRRYCTFLLGKKLFGIEVDQVQEVLRSQPITRVPLAPPVIAGLINLRGQVVLAIDLRVRLGIPPANPDRPPINVILRTDEGPLSLLVDEIAPVLEVEESAFEPVPETMRGASRELLEGAYKLPDRLLLALDAGRVIDVNLKIGIV